MKKKIIVDIKTAVEHEDTDGNKYIDAQIKIDDADFSLRTDEKVKTKEELAKLAVEEYKKLFREELMGEVKLEIEVGD